MAEPVEVVDHEDAVPEALPETPATPPPKAAEGVDELFGLGEEKGDSSAPRITVSDPQVTKSRFSKVTTYQLSAVPGPAGVGVIRRRYRDFAWLRDKLKALFPGVFIPPLPEKKFFGRFTEEFLEGRAEGLTLFMNRVARHRFLRSTEAFNLFMVRHENTLEDGKKEFDAKLKKMTLADIYGNVEEEFKEFMSRELPSESFEVCSKLKDYLEKLEIKLNSIAKHSNIMADLHEKMVKEIDTVVADLDKLTTQETLFAYKENHLTRHVVTEELTRWGRAVKEEGVNVAANLRDMIDEELADVKSWLESVRERESFAKTTIKKKEKALKWGDGSHLQEKDKPKRENDIYVHERHDQLDNATTKVMLFWQLPRMLALKNKRYGVGIHQLSQKQIDLCRVKGEIWKEVFAKTD